MDFLHNPDWFGRQGPWGYNLEYLLFYLLFLVFSIGLIVLLKLKKNPKAVKITLIVLWAINLGLDLIKLVAQSRDGFQIGSDMLLYICSLFLYAMPFAIWGKGKLKDFGCTFVCTIGLFGAIMNFAVPSVVLNNSLFSFYGLHTSIYHLNLLLVPFIMLITGYYKLSFKKFGWAFLGFVIMTIPALFFNFMAGTDWMYLKRGDTLPFPFVPALVEAIGFGWTLIAYAGYAGIQAILTGAIIGIDKLVVLIKNKVGKSNKEQPAVDQIAQEEK